MKAPIFISSFLKRYWRLLIVFVILVVLGKVNAVTYFVGPIFFEIELAVAALVAALFLIHCFLRKTLDAFSNDDENGNSQFERAWEVLDDATKVKLRVFVMVAFFLGCCWIAASIAK